MKVDKLIESSKLRDYPKSLGRLWILCTATRRRKRNSESKITEFPNRDKILDELGYVISIMKRGSRCGDMSNMTN